MTTRASFLAGAAALAGTALLVPGISRAGTGSPFDPFQRMSDRPLLGPRGTGFESAGVFNPAAVRFKDKTVLLYRAQDQRGTSRIGYAESPDGVTFTRRDQPVLFPQATYEAQGGVEDPRLVRIGDTFYLTYTAYDSVNQVAQLCLATSPDCISWERQGVILTANRGTWNDHWTKSGAIVPQKINGRWWMYYMGETFVPASPTLGQMGIAVSDDLVHWLDATPTPLLPARPRMFDALVVEPGPAPIITDQGILLIYNGADERLVYSTGWALFDKNDPTKLIKRADTPVFGAYLPWERMGQVPNVVFVEALVQQNKDITLYYGAADKSIGGIRTRLRP
ncbi:MAG: glycoside hydrolase family 130 protein [Candidatus Velthaea sp.]